ncbi:hypothetical protein D3C81_1131600 [compost metagenome]
MRRDAGLQGRRNTAAHLREQLLQRGENLLHAFVDGRRVVAFLAVHIGDRTINCATCRGCFQLGQHTGGEQQLIGFGVKLFGVGQDITLEQFEQDQLDLDLHAQITPGLEEKLTEPRRAERVVLIVEGVAEQRVKARGQLIEGEAVTLEHATDHGLDRHAALHVVAARCQFVVDQGVRQRVVRGVVLRQADEGFEKLLKEATLDVFALEAQVAHGFEEDVLLDVVARPVGHFKQRVVSVIEQLL